MAMQQLAPEIMVHIYESLSSVSDIISLSLTCRYFHELLPKSQKLALFFNAIDQELGPLDDILQLLTQNDSQTLHLRRTPPLSFALLSQVAPVAKVAERFVGLYPEFRWTEAESMFRRSLDSSESRRLRRALYRFWGYAQAFYSKSSFRMPSLDGTVATQRLQLLRTWTNEELCELEDFRCILEQILGSEICPTDGEVYSRLPADSRQLYFSFNSSPSDPSTRHLPSFQDMFHSSRESSTLDRTKPSVQELRFKQMQGWGSDIQNFYLIQSFLKFSPARLLWLFDNATSKMDVERFIELQTHDPCFFESGSMLFHDWVTVLHGRGVDVQQAREAIWERKAGIVLDGFEPRS